MTTFEPVVGEVVDGRYLLEEEIGKGGMGVVFRAQRVGVGKTVAIKFLSPAVAAIPDIVKRFRREVSAMSRLQHPHLTGVVDSGILFDVPFLVMEFQKGRSLGVLLDGKPVPGARAVGITRQILAGIRHAHDGGIVHRDLKPENVILLDDADGDFIKILDFGLAKILRGEGENATKLTHAGMALGTPSYMSPEQAKGTKVDRRSDIYSVGVILYYMVVGRRPFVAKSPVDLLRMHMTVDPAPPRQTLGDGCSVALERVILRALEKSPARRFQTARDFAAALEATPEGANSALPEREPSLSLGLGVTRDPTEPSLSAPGTVLERPDPTRRRRWIRRVRNAVVVLAALAVAAACFTVAAPQSARALMDRVHDLFAGGGVPPPPPREGRRR